MAQAVTAALKRRPSAREAEADRVQGQGTVIQGQGMAHLTRL